jgi:hypothetical protein
MTTPLAEKIKAIIRQNGPISVTDYFALCLADPEHGYYKTREPFGTRGDFITAPEVSQLFGEMIGIFLVHAWQKHLMPKAPVRIVEIGPGRGTMMADMLRVIRRLAPDLYAVASSAYGRDQRQAGQPAGEDTHRACRRRSHGTKVSKMCRTASYCWPPTSSSMPCRSGNSSRHRRAFASGWWDLATMMR